MVYPSVVMLVAIVVVVVMLAKVIPVFENMFKEFRGAKLPAPTQFVIKLSNGFVGNWYIYAGVTIAVIIGFSAMLRTKRGRLLFDGAILRIPVIGGVLRKIVVARFTRTLGTLLSSGVPILDALEICAKTAGNKRGRERRSCTRAPGSPRARTWPARWPRAACSRPWWCR